MIRCFGKSRAVFLIGLACTAGLTVAAAVQRMGYPLWVMGITAALLLLLGTAFSRMLADMTAAQCNQKLLSLLHIDLQPQQFVAAYAPVPGRAAPGGTVRVITSSYLADGYCAMGQPRQALEALVWDYRAKNEKSRMALQGLLLHNQCRYYLYDGDVAHAAASADRLQEATDRMAQGNPTLADSLRGDLKLYRIWMGILSGQTVDITYLEERLQQLPAKIAMLEMNWILAQYYLQTGQSQQADACLRRMVQEGGGLALAAQAAQLMQTA